MCALQKSQVELKQSLAQHMANENGQIVERNHQCVSAGDRGGWWCLVFGVWWLVAGDDDNDGDGDGDRDGGDDDDVSVIWNGCASTIFPVANRVFKCRDRLCPPPPFRPFPRWQLVMDRFVVIDYIEPPPQQQQVVVVQQVAPAAAAPMIKNGKFCPEVRRWGVGMVGIGGCLCVCVSCVCVYLCVCVCHV